MFQHVVCCRRMNPQARLQLKSSSHTSTHTQSSSSFARLKFMQNVLQPLRHRGIGMAIQA